MTIVERDPSATFSVAQPHVWNIDADCNTVWFEYHGTADKRPVRTKGTFGSLRRMPFGMPVVPDDMSTRSPCFGIKGRRGSFSSLATSLSTHIAPGAAAFLAAAFSSVVCAHTTGMFLVPFVRSSGMRPANSSSTKRMLMSFSSTQPAIYSGEEPMLSRKTAPPA